MINDPVVSTVTADETVDDLLPTLSLLQLTDSAFPTGRYTHSYGLEEFARSRYVTPASPSILLSILTDTLRLGVGPSDGIALACAHRALRADGTFDLEMLRRADRRLSAVKLASEARDASMRIGRTLLGHAQVVFKDADISELAQLVEREESPGNQAVITGVLSAKLGVPRLEAVAAELFAFSASWVAAAVRLGLVDHRVGQRILRPVLPVIGQAALRATCSAVEDIASCAPLLDVMSMRHEQAELRLFAS